MDSGFRIRDSELNAKTSVMTIKAKQNRDIPTPKRNTEKISPDVDSDKTGTDTAADHTKTEKVEIDHNSRYDKPEKEVDPDTTSIDTQNSPPSDQTNNQNNTVI